MEFGQYIRQLRAEKGISQEKLGKLAGISGSALSMIEAGQRVDVKVSTILGLSKALNVNPVKLFLAYQGKNPEAELVEEDALQPEAVALLKEIASKIPDQVILETLEERFQDPNVRRMAKKLLEETNG